MANEKYVIGLDYGSDSVRSLIVNVQSGEEVASEVYYYRRWKDGKYCDSVNNRFRQHPLDYLEGLELTITGALKNCPEGTAENVIGIAVDTTGSTPVAVNKQGTPLALTPEFAENPNAMFVLWKDHTAVKEAAEINKTAHNGAGEDFTKYVGGIYSSEWFFAKILHILREDEKVRENAFSWVEHCDWIPALLTGNTDPLTMKRSRCSAGHKAMWHPDFNGLPSKEFLTAIDPLLKGIRDNLFSETYTSDVSAGNLTEEWAEKLGLSTEVAVAVGAFDAHMGAVGGEIESYTLSKVMGTSTCDMIVAPMKEMEGKLIRGICGQVDGSIIPGMLGMEAGQSAFGDVYEWFRKILLWPVNNILLETNLVDQQTKEKLAAEIAGQIIPVLSGKAVQIPIDESAPVALDWINGRRTPDANQLLKGAIAGINMGTGAPRIFKALVEATAFGAKKIVDRFVNEGVNIKQVIALGGVAKKNSFVMQVVADVLNMKIKVARSEQTCALGAAMFAAVAAGVYPKVEDAIKAMGSGFETEYNPIADNATKYKALYEKYSKLGELIENELS